VKVWDDASLTSTTINATPNIEIMRITATGEIFIQGVPLAETSDADLRKAVEDIGALFGAKTRVAQ
jgi:hypothetical protein